MILIATSFALLVIVAGMFLLAKTQKDNLSNFFRYISFFVIIAGFLILLAGGAAFCGRMMMRHYAQNCEMQHMKKHSKKGMHEMGGMHGTCGMSSMRCGDDDKCMEGDKCSMHDAKCGEGSGMMPGDKSCCKDGMMNKMMMKKDSVVIKK